jgi:hypothetical protein
MHPAILDTMKHGWVPSPWTAVKAPAHHRFESGVDFLLPANPFPVGMNAETSGIGLSFVR